MHNILNTCNYCKLLSGKHQSEMPKTKKPDASMLTNLECKKNRMVILVMSIRFVVCINLYHCKERGHRYGLVYRIPGEFVWNNHQGKQDTIQGKIDYQDIA